MIGDDLAPWWWLSFADAALPAGEQFLGVAIVQGHNIAEAAMRAHTLGINPGGEAQGVEINPGPLGKIPDSDRNRLLTRAEGEAILERLKPTQH